MTHSAGDAESAASPILGWLAEYHVAPDARAAISDIPEGMYQPDHQWATKKAFAMVVKHTAMRKKWKTYRLHEVDAPTASTTRRAHIVRTFKREHRKVGEVLFVREQRRRDAYELRFRFLDRADPELRVYAARVRADMAMYASTMSKVPLLRLIRHHLESTDGVVLRVPFEHSRVFVYSEADAAGIRDLFAVLPEPSWFRLTPLADTPENRSWLRETSRLRGRSQRTVHRLTQLIGGTE